MSRFYVPTGSVKGKTISISGDEAHHILDVMRLKPLEKVVVFDGTGKEYTGFIKDAKRKSLTVEITGTREVPAVVNIAVTLIQAIPKKDKMDRIVEKATELGVNSVMPVVTGRTIVDWDEPKRSSAAERWRRIAREAAKQCGRTDIPQIGDVRPFADIVSTFGTYDLAMVAALSDGTMELKKALAGFRGKTIAIAIGPEGDFTPDEIRDALSAGARPVSLGPRVLKSDTAGPAVLAILDYELSR
ncbi:MAG: 16S rRNA (uracil(1498)-N(3))-methyltransferase [Candidatus Omnitrophica bacterium]|nr:16S rRNA (uracil(1498)-N(3))-methyltransferase [Candidatus Omnitrophota bacterium]